LRRAAHLRSSALRLLAGHAASRRTSLLLLFPSSLHSILSELLFKFVLAEGRVCDVGVSREDLDGLPESLEGGDEGLSLLGDPLRLSERLCQVIILVDLRIELELESLLRGLHEEVSNRFRYGVSHVSNGDLEVSVDTSSDLLNEDV
jgi:hypothetical protein